MDVGLGVLAASPIFSTSFRSGSKGFDSAPLRSTPFGLRSRLRCLLRNWLAPRLA
jgi:hypothetical protein